MAFSSPIKQWTIEKVAKELRKILDEAAVAKFVEQVCSLTVISLQMICHPGI